MPSLYEDLGVPEDATQEEITAAYRKKAKAAHPDNKETGNEDEFKRLSHAVAILSDEDKRKQYDRTGSESTASPEERELAMTLEMLSKFFQQLFTMAEFNPAQHSPIRAVKKLVKMDRMAARKKEVEIEGVLDKMRKSIKRLTRKGKDVKAGKLSKVLAQLEKSTAADLEQAQRRQRVCNKALDILKEHDYEVDPPPPPQPKPEEKKPFVSSIFTPNKTQSMDPVTAAAMQKLREAILEKAKLKS